MSACDAELCPNWTGQGCICAVLGADMELVRDSVGNIFEFTGPDGQRTVAYRAVQR